MSSKPIPDEWVDEGYIPSTNEIRDVWCEVGLEDEFDRWLAQVWDEGQRAEEMAWEQW